MHSPHTTRKKIQMPNNLTTPATTTTPTPPATPTLSPWLVRMLCDNCGEEHYRYFDTTRSHELIIVQGQCAICFDEMQTAMLALNMLQQSVGQQAWIVRLSRKYPPHTYESAPSWLSLRGQREDKSRTILEVLQQIKQKLRTP